MNLRISKQAQTDLIDIWEYTFNKWSLEQADKYYLILVEAMKMLLKEPNMGKSYEKIRKNYRGLQTKSHIIFYKISSQGELEVIRILHQNMDIPNKL